MKNPESHAGTVGWAILGAGILAWDLIAPETLSSAADRALEHPVGKYVVPLGAVALTAHVINTFDNYDWPDPIETINNAVMRLKDERTI